MFKEEHPPLGPADVMIVGFGPVGKLLAIRLGAAGHRIFVAERQHRGYPLPRAVTHDSEFARILQSVGLAPDTIPDVTEPYDDMYVWKNHAQETLLEVDWSGVGPSGWNNTYFFNQPDLEDRMDAVIRTLPNVTVLRGWSADVTESGEGSVLTELTNTESGDRTTVRSSYLIGADGANSTVRTFAGIGWHDLGYFFDWLVVDVKPLPSLKFPHVASQTCDFSRPATMVPGGPGRRRWEFMRLPQETAEELNTTTAAWKMLAPFGIDSGNAELERHSVYTFQAGWAQQWRKGRILLAGDAAHLMPPFAGQGLGAGVRDAMNLSWKLDAVLRGVSDDALLDSYGPERTPHVSRFIDFSMDLGRVICITDTAEAAERDARMIKARQDGARPPAPPNPQLGSGVHRGAAGGMISVQGRIQTRPGGPVTRADDTLGGGLLLVKDGQLLNGLDRTRTAALTALGITIATLGKEGPGKPVIDADGTYREWLEQLDSTAVLVRPDFYVYGTATSTDAVQDLVDSFLQDTAYVARQRAMEVSS